MRKNEVILNGKLTGTIGENDTGKKINALRNEWSEEFGEEFEAIQQTWRVNPANEDQYDGSEGYKDA
jgi:hypothetical protein